jgi:hypothetical protein
MDTTVQGKGPPDFRLSERSTRVKGAKRSFTELGTMITPDRVRPLLMPIPKPGKRL